MGKTYSYCHRCQENFANHTAFCSYCGNQTQSFPNNVTKLKSNDFKLVFCENRDFKRSRQFFFGATAFILIFVITAGIISIYTYQIEAANFLIDPNQTALLNDFAPVTLEESKTQKDKNHGGGGGKGKGDSEISKGELPPQFKEHPLLAPSKEDISKANPELPVARATIGSKDIIRPQATNGDPSSTNRRSSNGLSADDGNGMGQNGNGGIGINGRDGYGREGTQGIGNTIGGDVSVRQKESDRDEDERQKPPRLTIAKGVSESLKILVKPRPNYTDAARETGVQGIVTLKVTFLANGSIGNISVVSGLSAGLTEQAVNAARNIKFEAAKMNGVSQTVTKTMQFNFILFDFVKGKTNGKLSKLQLVSKSKRLCKTKGCGSPSLSSAFS